MATSNHQQAPILVVAALSRELSKLHRAADLALLETGEGVANAGRCLEAWLQRESTPAVLSIGFAGALSPALKVGDLVIATEVRGSNSTPDSRLLSAVEKGLIDGVSTRFGVALTSDEILWQSESKRAFATGVENRIGFVDMESTAVAGVCAEHGVPFLIARAITDLLDEDLPLDFNQYRDRDGRVNPSRVLRAALLQPASLAELMQLRRRSQLCAERLADLVRRLIPLIKASLRT